MSDGVGATSSPTAGAPPAHAHDREGKDLPPLPRRWEGGLAALSLTGCLAPVLGQVVAVLVYPLLPARAESSPAIPQVPVTALVVAVVVTLMVWALEFLLLAPMTSSPRAQPRFYTELIERYQEVSDRWNQWPEKEPVEVQTQLDWAHRALIGADNGPGLRWALGYGYVSVLRALHRAEEALILVEPHELVLRDAVYDQLCLTRSTIDTRDTLLKQITTATGGLSGAGGPDGDQKAREILRSVRLARNTFRDDARDGVLRARNQLLLVTFVASVLTFLLLGLAEVFGAPAVCLTTVAALYLVGATVGCFNRLRIEAEQSSAAEDHGLFPARLQASLLMSGLAAIGGVYLVAALPAVLPIEGAPRLVPALSTIFDLSSNSASLLYAAAFGLVPENLTKLLLGAADKLQTDLLASRPANSTAP